VNANTTKYLMVSMYQVEDEVTIEELIIADCKLRKSSN
jgi:hypothetical protein